MEGNVLNTAMIARNLVTTLAVWSAVAAAAWGQRVQFPSPLSQNPNSPIPGAGPPAVTLNGTIQPTTPLTPAPWDPYADPTLQQQTTPIYPQDGVIRPDGTVAKPFRAIHDVRLNYFWVAGDGSEEDRLNIHTIDTNVSVAFPFFYNPAPILITPGFTFHLLDGPDTPPALTPLPPRLYDAYLDASWKPVITSWLSGDLGARVGVYSDFRATNSDSIRVISRGLAEIHFTSRFAVSFGVVYLDRVNVKLLPAGGLTWTPNEDTRWELVFPYPKIAQRWTTIGNTDVWWYVRGEYGLGSWTIRRQNDGVDDRIDINDLRVATGLEFRAHGGLTGFLEAGYVWDREVLFVGGPLPFKPDDTIMLGAGLRY